MNFGNLTISVAALGVATFLPAHAQSLTGNVGSAGITSGERAVETRFGVDDEENLAGRIQYDHAFND